jgi:S-adenosylmethionine decarboxylase proenzyme
MFSEHKNSGKHLIADIKEIKNTELLNNIDKVKELLDSICSCYQFNIISKHEHLFSPVGFTVIYMLAESHLSIHTFPECNYFAFDLYTCRESENNDAYLDIYNFLLENFYATGEYIVIDRGW